MKDGEGLNTHAQALWTGSPCLGYRWEPVAAEAALSGSQHKTPGTGRGSRSNPPGGIAF